MVVNRKENGSNTIVEPSPKNDAATTITPAAENMSTSATARNMNRTNTTRVKFL